METPGLSICTKYHFTIESYMHFLTAIATRATLRSVFYQKYHIFVAWKIKFRFHNICSIFVVTLLMIWQEFKLKKSIVNVECLSAFKVFQLYTEDIDLLMPGAAHKERDSFYKVSNDCGIICWNKKWSRVCIQQYPLRHKEKFWETVFRISVTSL